MDQNFQTSFIPKRALAEDRTERPQSVNVFLFFGTILLLGSIAGAIFVFIYKNSLTTQVAQMSDNLKKSEAAFQSDFIQELQRTDLRLNAADEVLMNHVAVSPIFNELQSSTLKSIQYTKFAYSLAGEGTGAQVNVQMSGIGQSYSSIALEAIELGKNPYIQNPIFSNLAPNDQGTILFDLTFSIDPKFVMYEEAIVRGADTQNTSSNTGGQQQQTPPASGTLNQQAPTQNPGSATGGVVSFPPAANH